MPEPDPRESMSVERQHNGLDAERFSPLTDLQPDRAELVLTSLRRARIAAYLVPAPSADGIERRRLFVDATERADARTVVQVALREVSGGEVGDEVFDPLANVDTEAEFRALTQGWHIDTVQAVRAAERDLSREDEHWRARLAPDIDPEPIWLDDDHYIPPEPPPLPRLAAPTTAAILLLAGSILLLGLGERLGLPDALIMLLGITGVLVAAGMLVMRLRPHHDEDDDGAAV